MWEAERIAGTGKNDYGKTEIDNVDVDMDFAPRDGASMDLNIASQISAAKNEITLASMVNSSGAVLGDLIDVIERGVKVCGVYDGLETNQVIKDFEKSTLGTGQSKIMQWNVIKNNLVVKHSTPYHEDGPHDFMHNKLLVVYQQIVVMSNEEL